MTQHTPAKRGSVEMQVPSSGADYRPQGHPRDHERPALREIVGELRELVAHGVANSDACLKSLNEFGTSIANWNRLMFEQHVSDQKLQHELVSMTQNLVSARMALQQETATCDALHRAFTADKDKLDETAAQMEMCDEAWLS